MKFKQFLKENPDTCHYDGVTLKFSDNDAVVFGLKGDDVCVIDTVGQYATSIKIKDKELNIEQLTALVSDFNEVLIDMDMFEYYGEFAVLKHKIHYTIALAHFILQHTENGKVTAKKLNQQIVREAMNDIVTVGSYFDVSGRAWTSKKTMSFWESPTKEQVDLIAQQLKITPQEWFFEIPVAAATWNIKRYEELNSLQKVEMPHINHLLSPIAKEELRKQQKINKNRIPKGLGSRKKLPNQPKGKTTAQARAQLSTSEETEK
jgi:hypothetical protein